ncbi:unnamed protein product, partial [Ceratitis capitata]
MNEAVDELECLPNVLVLPVERRNSSRRQLTVCLCLDSDLSLYAHFFVECLRLNKMTTTRRLQRQR